MLYCYYGKKTVEGRVPQCAESDFLRLVNRNKLRDSICAEVIKDVDECTLLPDMTIDSPLFGNISLDELSGGVKCLLLMYTRPDLILRTGMMGDNCAKSLKRISDASDCHLFIQHAFKFDPEQRMYFPQYDSVVNGWDEYMDFKSRHYQDYLAWFV